MQSVSRGHIGQQVGRNSAGEKWAKVAETYITGHWQVCSLVLVYAFTGMLGHMAFILLCFLFFV